jgi:hypothetical protein
VRAPPTAALQLQLTRTARCGALRMILISVMVGLASGAVSVASGLRGHSLGVFAVGLGVLADVTGSATP